MLVALASLFVALGGVGYAATQLPANSVGSKQLQNNAVSYRKIVPGAVGGKRINAAQVQARVGKGCTSGAITSIAQGGKATCGAAPGAEFDTSSAAAVALTPVDSTTMTKPTAATVASESLAGGSSYVAFANPYIEVSTTSNVTQQVEIDCSFNVGPATTSTVTRAATLSINANRGNEFVSIPMTETAASSGGGITSEVSCSSTYTGGTSAPTVKVQSSINSIQTASNTTQNTTG
jgi:hypothetical protein